MPRKPLIAANWKMNPPPENIYAYKPAADVDVFVFPTFLDITACVKSGIITGGQFGHPDDRGARTGDISMKMLKDAGCTHVLCGHSERRRYHGETDEFIASQVTAAFANGITPILCVGETENERKNGKAKYVVKTQVETIPDAADKDFIIAYEPVWAIGTGNTATPEDAQEMHSFIRSLLPAGIRDAVRVLYGGSMKPENARALLEQPDIDGGLVGGASLDSKKFNEIIEAAASDS